MLHGSTPGKRGLEAAGRDRSAHPNERKPRVGPLPLFGRERREPASRGAVEAILAGDALLTIDDSARRRGVAWSDSPFGITRVDDATPIYGAIPVSAAGATLRRDVLPPAPHDGAAATVRFQYRRPPLPRSRGGLGGRHPPCT